MKKRLFLLALVLIFVISLSSCSKREAKTSAQFNDYMESKGFAMKDIAAENELDEVILENITADNEKYEMEFCRLKDADTAKAIYFTNRQLFEVEHPGEGTEEEISSGNYNYCTVTQGDDFGLFARLDDTVLLCITKKEYKEEVIKLAEEFGY